MLQAVSGQTFHKRLGGPANAFRYGVDYVLMEPDQMQPTPRFFSFNRRNLFAIHDRDHGGAPNAGEGVAWVRKILSQHELHDLAQARVFLLTQPRVLGYLFNPVSFWFVTDADETLRAVIAEVSNTFGDRHSYICYHDDLRPIIPDDVISARKNFHVSPYQPIAGDYRFRFQLTPTTVAVRIDLLHGNSGLVATLTGNRTKLSTRALLRVLVRRPFGSLRVSALIHWQALKLKFKGAKYRDRPEPPQAEVSR